MATGRDNLKGAAVGRVAVLLLFFIFLLFFIYSLTASGPALGASSGSQLTVQVTILPKLEYTILEEFASLEITLDDLERGYKDVQAGTVLSVTTNDANGYLLSVFSHFSQDGAPVNEILAIQAIRITTDGGDAYEILPDGTARIHIPFPGVDPHTQSLNYRFYLQEDAEAGVTRWPIAVDAGLF